METKLKIKKFPSRFKLYKEDIERGGSSIISIYIDKNTKKKYIVKELFYKEDKKQFKNLVHLGKDCKDFFVCPYGIFYKKGQYFIVMEYLNGFLNLDKTKYILSKKNRLLISKKIYHSILRLHKKNMTHNDLKPSNIVVNPTTLETRIIDFGSSTIFYTGKETFSPIDIGYTPGFITLNPHVKHSKDELIQNDILNLLYFLYKYVYDKPFTKSKLKYFEKKLNKK